MFNSIVIEENAAEIARRAESDCAGETGPDIWRIPFRPLLLSFQGPATPA